MRRGAMVLVAGSTSNTREWLTPRRWAPLSKRRTRPFSRYVPMAYHPGTGLAYVPVIENCATFTSGKAFFIKGQPYWGSSLTLM